MMRFDGMAKANWWRFIKFFGSGVLLSFLVIVVSFFVLAYTKIMDITIMLLLAIVWLLVGILPTFLTGLWLVVIRHIRYVNYMAFFMSNLVLAILFILGFILLTNNLSLPNFIEVLKVATVIIIVMGCISGLIAMLSGFFTLKPPKN